MIVDNKGLNALKLCWDENALNEIGKDKFIKILFKELSLYRKLVSDKFIEEVKECVKDEQGVSG